MEKLQELSSPAFRAAKLQARPEVTADPHMDPGYESDINENKPSQGTLVSSDLIDFNATYLLFLSCIGFQMTLLVCCFFLYMFYSFGIKVKSVLYAWMLVVSHDTYIYS